MENETNTQNEAVGFYLLGTYQDDARANIEVIYFDRDLNKVVEIKNKIETLNNKYLSYVDVGQDAEELNKLAQELENEGVNLGRNEYEEEFNICLNLCDKPIIKGVDVEAQK